MVRKIYYTICIILLHVASHSQDSRSITIVSRQQASPRIAYAVTRLSNAFDQLGYTVTTSTELPKHGKVLVLAEINSRWLAPILDTWKMTGLASSRGKEGFSINVEGDHILITGNDPSGVLYGSLEFIDQLKKERSIPRSLSMSDKPEMQLRGACIGLQKPYYLPDRTVYEYPYTPETFPWFYDRNLWIQYLDSMVNNRMNSLYLWNGHPFASLVRVKEYPYAVEVDAATFRKNEEIYSFLTKEADRRGIWVIQMFYNIIVSKPFAERHGIKTQDRERPIIPLIADYTRKSIAAFVAKYPNVGLMVCLGEAMEGTGPDDVEWFTKTIIPGVQDGLRVLGKKEEPPIVLRAHDTDAPAVMRASLPLYKNLYTEAKFNGEALTTPRPRGAWAELHQTLSKLGSVQIENVHILANLEPFRYGSANFIQQSVIGMHEVMGGNGLHLYPQASYWDWPYSADSVKAGRLLQIERDWIWYKAWSRYAWKARRDRKSEVDYWSKLLADQFGCNSQSGAAILTAYEESGEIAPKLLRRFGITDGNRQTLTLGMLMTQLINPFRYGLFTLLYESESPEGEMLVTYAEKEWKGEKHIGETPVQVIHEVREHARKAVAAVTNFSVGKRKEEFERIKNDMLCYQALANHFAFKAEAALQVLRFKYSDDIADLEKALPLLESSVKEYRELARLTRSTYLYANSMQTQQRKIPIRGVDGTYKKWDEVLIPFEQELLHFKESIDSLKTRKSKAGVKVLPLKKANVQVHPPVAARFVIDSLAVVFPDTTATVLKYAPELKGLEGVSLDRRKQIREGTEIRFSSTSPVKLLVGYFKPVKAAFTTDSIYLKPPELETNASANEYGQSEIKIANAVVIKGFPPLNVHSYSFDAGSHVLKLAKGVCLILGFVEGRETIPLYDAGLTETGATKEIDWLFE